jgi:hypothetical protein
MKTGILRLLLLVLAYPSTVLAGVWYAAPNPLPNGNGSFQQPWTLAAALTNQGLVKPGDTLYMRGGRYMGPGFVSTLSGTSNNYITVRSYPREWAVVTDGLVGTLRTSLNASPTNALNVSISGFEKLAAWPVFMIGSEWFYTVGRVGTNWNLVRGWGGSTIVPHPAGAPATLVVDLISHTGSYVTFRDFEITAFGSTNRVVGISNFLGCGLNLSAAGHGNKAINLIVHNTGHPGIGFWQQGAGGEINGCLIWGTGQYDYSENFRGAPRGSAIYSQNAGGMATIKNIISFRNFTSGGKVFGETGPVRDFQFVSNIVFQCTPTLEGVSGSSSASNLWWNGNIMMGTPTLHYVSLSNSAQYFVNNLIVAGSFYTGEYTDSVYTNNTVLMTRGVGSFGSTIGYGSSYLRRADLRLLWDYNTYYLGDGSSPYNFGFNTADLRSVNGMGGGSLRFDNDGTNTWSGWSGYDTHSTYSTNWPANYLKVSVERSDYDSNRWHVAVVSTSGQTNADLVLSDYGFENGARYQVIDAQNWPAVIAAGTYDGGAVGLPLNLTNVSTLPGATHFTNEHTNVKSPGLFNVFVLQRLSSISPPTNVRVRE